MIIARVMVVKLVVISKTNVGDVELKLTNFCFFNEDLKKRRGRKKKSDVTLLIDFPPGAK